MKTITHFSIFLFLLFTYKFSFAQLSAQEAYNAQKKYWYYRYRLLNDFMLEGDCEGCSIPADARDNNNNWNGITGLNGHSILSFGEDSKTMGYYVAILATEYKMLSDNNENADSTARELYFALQTLKRLDYQAEIYFNGSGSYNGFLIRDDIHKGFLKNNWEHFNSGKTSPLTVDTLYSQYIYHNSPQQLQDSDNNNAVGKDDYIYLLVGLSSVVKFVPDTANYNGFYYVQEANDIIDRIVHWMKTNQWFVKNAVTNVPLGQDRGGPAQDLCYPLADVACKMHGSSGGCFTYQNLFSRTYGYKIWQVLPNFIPYSYCQSDATGINGLISNYCKNSYLYYPLAATCNCVHKVPLILQWDIINLNLPALLFYIENWTIIPTLNNTKKTMSKAMFQREEDLPLLWADLWGKDIHTLPHWNGNPRDKFDSLLNAAPCVGPYWFPTFEPIPAPYVDNYASYDWSTSDRFRQISELGNSYQRDSIPKPSGEYPGLDYMLFHNLYYLYYGIPSHNNYSPLPRFDDLMDIHTNDISTTYPFTIPPPINYTYGNSIHPANFDAFRSITSTATINNDGVVTMRAGERIDLKPGFHTEPGAYFHAYIAPFHCSSNDSTGQYQRNSNGSGLYGMGNTIPPGQNHFIPVNPPQNEDITQQPQISQATLDSLKAAGVINEVQYEQLIKEIQPQNDQNTGIKIYPNPSHNIFNVSYIGSYNVSKIAVFDVTQRKIDAKITKTGANSLQIDLSDQPKGVYFLRIGATVKRMVLE